MHRRGKEQVSDLEARELYIEWQIASAPISITPPPATETVSDHTRAIASQAAERPKNLYTTSLRGVGHPQKPDVPGAEPLGVEIVVGLSPPSAKFSGAGDR